LKIEGYIKKRRALIDRGLDRLLPKETDYPQVIHRAIRYSLKKGKRIRPILCLACAEMVGCPAKKAIKTACAIEIIHTYSLVHDDLPYMDNDDYRRGRLTCHKKFGVANAVLAGDALLTIAFKILSEATEKPALNVKLIGEIATAAGTSGMIGGQVVDISDEEKSEITLRYINIHKTGALIAVSCKTGAMLGSASKKDLHSISKFGEYIGLAFQIVDDILDNNGIVNLIGLKAALQQASELMTKAKKSISYLGTKRKFLYSIADMIISRADQKVGR
jgi:geranylgeranyl diphosphate synthase type II